MNNYKEFLEVIEKLEYEFIDRNSYFVIGPNGDMLRHRSRTMGDDEYSKYIYDFKLSRIDIVTDVSDYKDCYNKIDTNGFEYYILDVELPDNRYSKVYVRLLPGASKMETGKNNDGIRFLDGKTSKDLESYHSMVKIIMKEYTTMVNAIDHGFSTLNSSEYTDGRDAHMSILENLKEECLDKLNRLGSKYGAIDISKVDNEKLIDNISILMEELNNTDNYYN